jgi:GNAT superfamily N-acetyltransferase
MQIRLIEQSDIPAVSAMLQELASEFILQETEPALALRFLQSNSPAGIADNIANDYTYHVAEHCGVIAGFIGMRERRHVFHLFVGKSWQGQGISRLLWDAGRKAAIDAGARPPFTVNASNYAFEAYQRLGFVRTAPMAIKNGVRFNAMQWDCSQNK